MNNINNEILECVDMIDDCVNTEQCHLCFDSGKYKAPKKKQQGLRKNYNKQHLSSKY